MKRARCRSMIPGSSETVARHRLDGLGPSMLSCIDWMIDVVSTDRSIGEYHPPGGEDRVMLYHHLR